MTVNSAPLASTTDPFDLMHLGWSFMRSKVLLAAMELKVFEELAKDPGGQEDLRSRLGLHERGATDFLDTLTSLGLLNRVDGTYSNSQATSTYLVTTSPSYIGDFLLMTTRFMGRSWESLAETLRTGAAHKQDADGEVPFAQIFRDPVKLRGFLSAMDSLNGSVTPALAEIVPTEGVRSFVDLGGARGNLAGQFVLRHPGMHGTVFDRPAMRPFFDELVEKLGATERTSFHGGDFFKDEVPSTDMAIFGNVLHDFSAEQRLDLLKRAHGALNDGGYVVVYDPMIDDERSEPDNLLMSLSMMIQAPGGCEYTPADLKSLLVEAGFDPIIEEKLPAHATAVIARKR